MSEKLEALWLALYFNGFRWVPRKVFRTRAAVRAYIKSRPKRQDGDWTISRVTWGPEQ